MLGLESISSLTDDDCTVLYISVHQSHNDIVNINTKTKTVRMRMRMR